MKAEVKIQKNLRVLTILVALWLILCTALGITAMAATALTVSGSFSGTVTGNGDVTKLILSASSSASTNTKGSVTIDGLKATLSAESDESTSCNETTYTGYTTTLTIQNPYPTEATLSYTEDDVTKTATLAASTETSTGTLEISVDSNGVASKSKTFIITDFSFEVSDEKFSTKFEAVTGGTYSIMASDGGSYAVGQSYENLSDVEYTVTATPASGYRFAQWRDGNGKALSSANTFSFNASNMTIQPFFVKSDAAEFTVGSTTYYYLDQAITAAGTSGTIIVTKDGGAYASDWDTASPTTSFTIQQGVTLQIPFDSANTLYTDTPADNGNATWVEPSPYRTLTLPANHHLVVNGSLNLSAVHHTGQALQNCGLVTGKYAHLAMESGSTVTVNNRASLYCWGYITGSGSVTANSGAKVYEYFTIQDFKDGNGCKDMYDNRTDKRVFLTNNYYVQNILVPLTVNHGAYEYGYTSVYMQTLSKSYGNLINFIGPSGSSETYFFTTTSGYLTKEYQFSTDRMKIDLYCEAELQPIKLKVNAGIMSVTFKSEEYDMALSSTMTLNIKNGGKLATTTQSVALIPGSEVIVDEGGTIVIGGNQRVVLYDIDQWQKQYSYNARVHAIKFVPDRQYTFKDADLKDGMLLVNGTVDATNGQIYTTAGGANIYSTGNGEIKLPAYSTATSSQYMRSGQTFDDYTIETAWLKNGDSSYTKPTATATTTFTYNEEAGKWQCEPHTDEDKDHTCDVCGFVSQCADSDGDSLCDTCGANLCAHAEMTETPAVAATCTTAGNSAYWTCGTCGKFFSDAEATTEIETDSWVIDALGHKTTATAAKAATCKEAGNSAYWYCEACETYFSDEACTTATTLDATVVPVDANNHVNTTTTTVEATCTANGSKTVTCDDCGSTVSTEEIQSTGHKLTKTEAVAATCTEKGNIEYWTCSVCNTMYSNEQGTTQVTDVTTDVDASNHTNIVTDAAVEETCTTDGKTEGSHCGDCNVVIKAQTTVTATGHTYGDVTYTWSENDTKCTATRTCSCGAEETAEASVETTTSPATCVVAGSTTTTATFEVSWASAQEKTASTDALGCNYGDGVVTTAATCTTNGVKTYTCGTCGGTKTEAVDALGHIPGAAATCATAQVCTREGCGATLAEATGNHSYTVEVEGSRTDATCKATGSVTMQCATCTDTEVQTLEIDPDNHAEIKKVAAQAPTCSAVGWEAYEHCTECTYTTYSELAVNADAHSWGDWSVTTSATCTAEGVETRTCAHNSAHTETNPIAKLSHSMTHHARVDTTCVAAGNVEYWSCSACNLTYSDEPGTTKLDSVEIPIDPDAHDLMTVPAQTATCTQIGWAEYQKCQRDGCDHSTYVEIPMLAHSYTTKASERLKDAATCTTAATYYVRCDHCTAVSTDKTVTVGEAKGHTEATSYVHIENTTTHNVVVSCSVCTANISTTPQNCADEDNDFKCDKCKALLVNAYTDYVDFCPEFSGEKTVDGTAVTLKYTGEVAFAPAAGNGTWNHWFGFKVTAPTGVSVANVTILRPDGETRVMENIKDGDDFAYLYWGMTKDEDKTAAYQIDWNGDGTYDLTVTLDATAATLKECEHSYDEGEVTTAPGCETAGEKTYTCANCGDIKTEPVEATGHKNTVIQNASEATCGKDGYTGDTYCNDCQMTIETGSVISATGNHTWDNACDTDCNVCGTTRETEHQWNEGVETTAPTCTAAGVKTFTCTVDGCGATKTEAIAATGHSHSTEWSKDETHHWHECACGNKGDYDVHKWNDGVETTAPTTSAPGVMTYTCSVCGATKAEEIAQLTGTMVDIDVVTKDLTSGPQIALLSGTTAGDGWSYEGSVIAGETVDFTVTFDKACVVVVATTDADGNVTYARQTATATENENTYKFSIDTSEGMEIIVAVKGDANGDGKITNADANMTKAFVLGNATPITTMGEIICDVNNKGGITNADSNMIKAYVLGNYVPITW